MAASRFSVGRKTIIKVYDELERRGLIVRRRGAGTALTCKADRDFGRIGLIIHGSNYCELFAPIARRMSHLCQKNGLALLFVDLSGDAVSRRVDKIAQTAADFVKTGVNGVIFQPVELVKNAEAINRKILATFDEAGVPVVLLDSDIVRSPERSRYDLAAVNHVEAGRRIGAHLVECGAKRIAFLMEREHAPCVQDRYLGVRIGAEGRMAKGAAVYARPDNAGAIRRAVKSLKIDAFACYNDREARLLITTLAQLGYAVPKDIKVAGFDDVNYATISAPALTTAHQPCDGLADLAFEMLMARIDRPDAPPRQTFLDALLVEVQEVPRGGRQRIYVFKHGSH
jgi:LacI family transcriptional regulator